MGFRFRRSIKIDPGVRWNLSKSGSSWSFGGKGFTANVRKGRVTRTFSIPGTGLSFRETAGSTTSAATAHRAAALAGPETDRSTALTPGRFGLPVTNPLRSLVGWVAIVSLLSGFVFPVLLALALVLGIVFAALPRPSVLVERELTRRQSDWTRVIDVLPSSPNLIDISSALERFRELELTPEEGGSRLKLLEASRDLLMFEKQTGGALSALEGLEAVVGDDACYFNCAVEFDKRGPNDESGMLYITATRLVFVGASLNSMPWSKVSTVSRDEASILIQREDRKTPIIFVCADLTDALKAEFVIRNVRASLEAPSTS